MPISRNTIAGSLAGVALLLSAGAAFATPGQATAAVNVRSGPGTSYGIVDSLAPGESVDVQQCRGSWCYIEHSGPDGWVSANFLSTGEGDNSAPVYDDDDDAPPPVYYDEPEYAPDYLPSPGFYGSPGYRDRPYYHRQHWQHGSPGQPPVTPPGRRPHVGTWQPSQPHVNTPWQGSGQPHVNTWQGAHNFGGNQGVVRNATPRQPAQNPCAADPNACQAPGWKRQ